MNEIIYAHCILVARIRSDRQAMLLTSGLKTGDGGGGDANDGCFCGAPSGSGCQLFKSSGQARRGESVGPIRGENATRRCACQRAKQTNGAIEKQLRGLETSEPAGRAEVLTTERDPTGPEPSRAGPGSDQQKRKTLRNLRDGFSQEFRLEAVLVGL